MANNEIFTQVQNKGYIDVTLVLGLLAAADLPDNFTSTSQITQVVLTTARGVGAGDAKFATTLNTGAVGSQFQISGCSSAATDLSDYRVFYSN